MSSFLLTFLLIASNAWAWSSGPRSFSWSSKSPEKFQLKVCKANPNDVYDEHYQYSDREFVDLSTKVIDRKRYHLKKALLTNAYLIGCLKGEAGIEELKKLYKPKHHDRIPEYCNNKINMLKSRIKRDFADMRQALALSTPPYSFATNIPTITHQSPNRYAGMPMEYYRDKKGFILTSAEYKTGENMGWGRCFVKSGGFKITPTSLKNALNPNIVHPHGNSCVLENLGIVNKGVADLPPLTPEEIISAIDIIDEELVKFQADFFNSEPGKTVVRLNHKNRPEYRVANAKYFAKFRQEQYKRYTKLIEKLAIMAFVTSEEPSNQELLEATNKLNQNTLSSLSRLEDEYYSWQGKGFAVDPEKINSTWYNVYKRRYGAFYYGRNGSVFHQFASKIPLEEVLKKKENQKYCHLAEQIRSDLGGWSLRKGFGAIFTILGGLVWCSTREAVTGFCEATFGVGINTGFWLHEELLFTSYMQGVYTDAYGQWDINKMEEAKEMELGRYIERVMLPFGTGASKFRRGLKDFIKEFQEDIMSSVGKMDEL